MRYLVALVLLVGGAAAGLLVYRHMTAGVPVVLPRPRLQVSAAGSPLQSGGWTASPSLDLRAVKAGVAAGVDVEIRKQGVKFKNAPTQILVPPGQVAANCTACVATGSGAIRLRLPDGGYHLQARLHNKQGVSPWVRWIGSIYVDTSPPVLAQVDSRTNPVPTKTYHSSTVRFAWQATDSGSGVAGYSYRLDSNPKGLPRAEVRTDTTSVTLNGLTTGKFYFHVRAIDRVGNWGDTSTFPVRVDVTPPGLAHVNFNRFQLDPQFDHLTVSFAVTRPAPSVRVGVYRQKDGGLVRLYTLTGLQKGQQTAVSWDGKDAHGNAVPSGSYEIFIRAIDQYGHSKVTGWSDFVLDYRRVMVSLSQQKLWAYDGNKLIWTSLVTTGNRALPTPLGTYHIMAKLHPFTFHSPWPKTSPFYYKPSKTEYAMLFREGGYFLHDAPWRSAFGPGTNSQIGTPGSNYTGTHGCINVPPNVAQELFSWTRLGTVVQVVD
jgi:lipoprotein-anchoring transpeptidase ErfK/SrfK